MKEEEEKKKKKKNGGRPRRRGRGDGLGPAKRARLDASFELYQVVFFNT